MRSSQDSTPNVEINLIWLGGKKLPESQEENFKKLILSNKPPAVINVWTDEDSQQNFESFLQANKHLHFNIKDIKSLRNDNTSSIVFECIDTLFQPNHYYSAMGDYLKSLIVGRPLIDQDATFRIYTEFDDAHSEKGFAAELLKLKEIPPLMWRIMKSNNAIEPDFLAINMASPIGKLSATYLVTFTEKVCGLVNASAHYKNVFVERGADANVIRSFIGEHLNYSIFGLKVSMEKTDEFKDGFNFGYVDSLGTNSKRRQEFSATHHTPSSWESAIIVKDKERVMTIGSVEIKFIQDFLLSPYRMTIKEMGNYGLDSISKMKVPAEQAPKHDTSSLGIFGDHSDKIETEVRNKPQQGIKH